MQFLAPSGSTQVPGGQSATSRIAPTTLDRQIARRGSGSALTDRTVRGTRLRVLTLGTGERGAVMIARPLSEVEHELSSLVLLLVAIGVAGIALAALFGTLVARTALAPIARFTRRTESLTGSLDLSERLEVTGRDEIARLAESFNTTLDALERSVEAQRHLIADASHELRTPIASLRVNIEVLGEAARLPASEQESLRRDIVSELDELTALVGDVVELARGSSPRRQAPDEVRLDEVVREALERARRRSDVRWDVRLEPTLLSAHAGAIGRAVSNLLDNACRWSPRGGLWRWCWRAASSRCATTGRVFARGCGVRVRSLHRAQGARSLPGSGLGLAIVRQAAEAGGDTPARRTLPAAGRCCA